MEAASWAASGIALSWHPRSPADSVLRSPRLDRPQWFDTLEERTNGEVVGERLLVLPAGHPDLLPVGSVQPGVVPHNRPGREGPACLGRADRWALILAHQASLQPCATPLEVGSVSHKPNVERERERNVTQVFADPANLT
jgi:hypothetical protein